MQSQKNISSVQKIMKLVAALSPEEQSEIQRKLGLKEWGKEWDRLSKRVRDRCKKLGLTIPTEAEVAAEVTAHRREKKAKRA